jgi:hypothetical protein
MLGRDMQAVGSAQRFVIGRENNVVLVDFHRPIFPGAGGLRAVEEPEDEGGGLPRQGGGDQ